MLNLPFQVYFAFPDGLLRYNCPECGFQCCKGAGFGVTAKEMTKLEVLYPTLKYFAQPATRRAVTGVPLINLKPKCFFLQDSGFCDIQAKHGRDFKPIVCKTFPANAYFFSNDILVVDVNFLCPLKISSSPENDAVLYYEDILKDIMVAADYIKGAGTVTARRPEQPPQVRELTKQIIQHETWSRDSFRRIETTDLFDVLATWELTSLQENDSEPEVPPPHLITEKKQELELFRRQIVMFIGAEDYLATRSTIDDMALIVLSSSIRMSILKRFPHIVYETEFLPSISRIFCAASTLVQLASITQGTPCSLQAVSTVTSSFLAAIFLLGHLDHVPTIPAPREGEKMTIDAALSYEGNIKRFFQFVYEQNDELNLTLREIVEQHAKEDRFDSLMFLKSLSGNAISRMKFLPKGPTHSIS
ncbi:MAG TPA: hypothetical protein VI895_13765 [Bdellovibrionota bacterium]|nr:hypothetical protein [Bdellovibrionota bacterium]